MSTLPGSQDEEARYVSRKLVKVIRQTADIELGRARLYALDFADAPGDEGNPGTGH